jgi:hypothetical protein
MVLTTYGQEAFPCFSCGGGALAAYGQSSEAAVGAGVSTGSSAAGASATRSVALGVCTGLLIWLITRSLDHHVFGK